MNARASEGPEEKPPFRAAIYTRVSTEDQAREGYSLEAQLEMLSAYCEAEDLIIGKIYVDDGYSGRDIKRPGYRTMMSELDVWDIVLVIKMDRIHRNSRNFMNMMEFLDKNGKGFVSSTESLDTESAVGRFVVDMIQRIAQLESEQIGERTYMGMKEKAESFDGIMGFTAPFGYKIDDGNLAADENEFDTAVRIFDMYLDGMTIDDISYTLNREGVLTRKGNLWNKYNLRNILHNPVYAGYMRWDGILIPHNSEIALDPGAFNIIQEIMASRTKGSAKFRDNSIPEDLYTLAITAST